MRNLIQLLWGVFKGVCGALLLFVIAVLAFVMFLGAPIALVFETADIVRSDSQTIGVVTKVDSKSTSRGASTQITYQFTANDQTITSKRVFPGFLGNKGGYTGSSRLADEFPVGKECVVYYDSSCPTRCSLKLGWFCWSIGFTAGVWGLCFSKTRRNDLRITIPATTASIYAGGLLFIGPLAVQWDHLHWHGLALLGIGVLVAIYQLATRDRTEGTAADTASTAT